MLIGFNGQRLAGQRYGVGRYIEYLLRFWSQYLTPDERVELYLRRPLDADGLASLHLSDRVKPVLLESTMSGVPWETLRLRRIASRTDVLFCPAYSAPLAYPGRLVVATHSVNEQQAGAHGWTYPQTYGRLYRHAAQRAEAVIVPSAGTGEQVSAVYGVPMEKIRIVEQGAADDFHPVTDPAALRAVRERYFGGDRPYILFVGSCSERRNIPRLVEAYARVRLQEKIPHGLLVFGANPTGIDFPALARRFGVEGDVVQTDGRIARHAELIPVYSAADLYVHPSEFEGWSMTTVEAMACGVAVVAADRGGLGEVARGHALMVQDPTVDALAGAMARVLSDSALRTSLQQQSLARAAGLRWSIATRATLDVVRAVGAGRSLSRH